MKLISFFILLLLVPEFAMAQEFASTADTSSSMNEQAAAPDQLTGRSPRNASAVPVNNSPIELNALFRSKSMAAPYPGELKQATLPERAFMEDWREQMFKKISEYFGPLQQDPLQISRMLTDDELDKRANERRTVMRLVLKETVKFSKERVVEIDRLVKALKYEVSSDKTAGQDSGPEANDIKTGDNKITDKKTGDAPSARNAVVNDKGVIKTGLRVRIDSGKLGLVSETEARYGKASYFYKLNLDNQGDNSLGFRYILGRNIYLQVERDFNHTMDPAALDRPSTNLIQLGCRF